MRLSFGWESISNTEEGSRLDPLFLVLSVLLPLFVSLPLLGTDLIAGQLTENILGVLTLGIVQVPGSPLYLLLTRGISLLVPNPSEIWRVQFASLLFGASSSIFIFLIGRRLRFPPVISLAASWLFFFTPVFWQQALLATPNTFHFLLLLTLLYFTLDILGPTPWRNRPLKLFVWAVLSGLVGGQEPKLLPWVMTLLFMGFSIGFPRHRVKTEDLSPLLLGLAAGIFLPYLYLPFRVLAPHAYLNMDAWATYSGLLQTPTFSNLLSWQLHYGLEGFRFFFAEHSFHLAFSQLTTQGMLFVRAFPFLPLVIVLLGLLLNVRDLFLKTPSRESAGIDFTSRLIVVILPICALGGEALLLSKPCLVTQLTLTVGSAFWSLKGLDYCYQILGHSDELLSKNQRLHPTWFALLVIFLVPALAVLQNYSVYKNQAHARQAQHSTLEAVSSFLKQLPPRAIVTFASTEIKTSALYAQQRLGLRQDLQFLSVSDLWPDKVGKPPTLFHFLRQHAPSRSQEKRAFARAWMQGLKERVLADRPVFLVTAPMRPDFLSDSLLQTFDLTEALAPVTEWITPTRQRRLNVFRIHLRPNPIEPTPAPLIKPYLANFEDQVRLVFASVHHPVKQPGSFSVLRITLQWQLLQQRPLDNLLLQFWITPASERKAIPMADGQAYLWKTLRPVGQDLAADRVAVKSVFQEQYQLWVPTELPAGHYVVYIGILPAGDQAETQTPGYFTSACDFWVTDKETAAGASEP